MPPAARKRPLPDAEIDGAEVSWARKSHGASVKECSPPYPRAAPSVGEAVADGTGAAATDGTSLGSSTASVRARRVASNERWPSA